MLIIKKIHHPRRPTSRESCAGVLRMSIDHSYPATLQSNQASDPLWAGSLPASPNLSLAGPAGVQACVARRWGEQAAACGRRRYRWAGTEASSVCLYRGRPRAAGHLAIESFADAMEIIPKTLAENAGLDQIDTLVALRSAHEKGIRARGWTWTPVSLWT